MFLFQELRVPLGRRLTTAMLEEAVTIATVAITAAVMKGTGLVVMPRTKMMYVLFPC